MKNKTKLSTIALFAAALAATPVSALSLNLGGDGPLVDLGDGGNADATVSVDTGNVLGGGAGDGDDDGGLLDLGGNGNLLDLGGTGTGGALIDLSGDDETDAAIEIDLGTTGAIDGGGTGLFDIGADGLLNLGSEGTIVDLGDGPLLDLSGNDDADAAVEIDLGETGSIGGDGITGGRLLDLGGDAGVVDLTDDGDVFAPGTDATADFGDSRLLGDVNLGGGEGPLLDLDFANEDDGLAGTSLLPNTLGKTAIGGGNVATFALSNPDSTGSGDGGDDGTGGGADATGGADDTGGTGGDSDDGTDGTVGDDEDDPGIDDEATGAIGTLPPRVPAASARGRAAAGGGSSCLSLTGQDINYLVERHDYDWPTFTTWADATSMNVVEVDICDDVEANIDLAVEASANVDRLQGFLASQAKVRAGLQQTGYTTEDVIAADDAGDTLVVYVTKG